MKHQGKIKIRRQPVPPSGRFLLLHPWTYSCLQHNMTENPKKWGEGEGSRRAFDFLHQSLCVGGWKKKNASLHTSIKIKIKRQQATKQRSKWTPKTDCYYYLQIFKYSYFFFIKMVCSAKKTYDDDEVMSVRHAYKKQQPPTTDNACTAVRIDILRAGILSCYKKIIRNMSCRVQHYYYQLTKPCGPGASPNSVFV